MGLEQAARQLLEIAEGIQHGTDWNNGTHAKIYRPKFPEAITALREALAEPVKLAISEEAFNWIDANAPMFVREALAGPQITTPDVCGEVCARAKLCYGCNKNLEEANAKYAEQAEQEPVAWALSHSFGLEFSSKYPMQTTKEAAEQMARQHMGAVVVTPLYAAPVQQAEQKPMAVVEDWPTDKTPKGIVALGDIKELPAGTLLYASPAISTEVFTREKVDSLLIAAYTKGRNDLLEKQAEQEPVIGAYEVVNEKGDEWSLVYPAAVHRYKSIPEERITQTFYAAPVSVTTPDVCGEVCARAKLCYGCNKNLEEANAKYAEQAEQEPVAWMQKGTIEWIKQPRNERNQTQVIVTGVNVFDGQIPLYAAPVRTKDLTDDEIMKINVDTASIVPTCDRQFHFARAVIAADREKNRG